MSENDIDNELRNLPQSSVENANEFITEYWQQMRLAKKYLHFSVVLKNKTNCLTFIRYDAYNVYTRDNENEILFKKKRRSFPLGLNILT